MNPPLDHPRAQELAEKGRIRSASEARFLKDDRETRDLVVQILKDNPDLRREDLADLSGLSLDIVKRLATEHGIPSPRTKAQTKARTDTKIADAIRDRPAATTKELAAAVGVSPARVTAYLREHGLPPRPRR
ncbi:winged helix-turn-helix domain-containing protein [Nocardiopsis alba]|uniref:winged helix-turn-helix domain-containing protein n=1 Tax=Nocardiopsis alba TaxID=53437 RepID=UPI0033BBF5ED